MRMHELSGCVLNENVTVIKCAPSVPRRVLCEIGRKYTRGPIVNPHCALQIAVYTQAHCTPTLLPRSSICGLAQEGLADTW